MCTAIALKTKNNYFGRNLDLEYSYNETVTITPRCFPFNFRHQPNIKKHYAMIGIATIEDNFPLYYDAVNEKGLAIAALNFPGNAKYLPVNKEKSNIAPFELIPWILSLCSSVKEAAHLLQNANIAEICFNERFPVSPLHWMLSDKTSSIVIEPLADGIHLHKNPIGVLTNSPPFEMQLFNLNNYMHLSNSDPENTFSKEITLGTYSRGMGGFGLPGDLSSQSRFVRAAFTKLNSVCEDEEDKSITQFFHILSSVEHTKGVVKVNDKFEITVYSSCCNTDNGIYYYKTYENSCIQAVAMQRENLDSTELISYPIINNQTIISQN